MHLREIVLHNVGPYLGRCSVDLSPASKKKPVLLFGGLNGGGKTTFLEAIQLCLYGELAKSGKRQGSAYENYLTRLLNDAVDPEEGASIELEFDFAEDSEPRRIRVIRTWKLNRKRVGEDLQVLSNGKLDRVLTENWEEAVEQILPQKLCGLFFFDGEQIEALADPSRSQEMLQTAISSLLGLELVDQLEADLAIAKRRNLVDQRDEKVKIAHEEIERQLEQLATQVESAEKLRAECAQEIGSLRNELEKVERIYAQEGGDIVDESKNLEESRSRVQSEIVAVESEMRFFAGGAAPLSLLKGRLQELAASSDSEEKQRLSAELLPILKQRDSSLTKFIEENCKDEAFRAEILRWLSASRKGLSEVEGAPPIYSLSPLAIQQLSSLVTIGFDENRAAIASFLEKIERLREKLDSIDRKLARRPDDEAIAELINRRAELRASLEAHERHHQSHTVTIESIVKRKVDLELKRDRFVEQLQKDLSETKIRGRMADTADRITGIMKEFRARVLSKHLSKLEGLILECFQSLLRKQCLVASIQIDADSLELSVVGRSGDRIPPNRLSAGERQLLATAVLWGLGRASGRSLPVIIDTPLGRLDASHRTNLIEKYFPSASHQVILLSTDEEIDGKYYKKLAPYVAAEYEIFLDEERGGSSVRSGYPFEEAA